MSCEQCRDRIIRALYDELSAEERQSFDTHLGSSPSCASQYTQMQVTLTMMSQRERMEPNETAWKLQWQSLQRKIESGRPDVKSIFSSKKVVLRPVGIPAWAYGLAAMLLITVGVYIGRTFLKGQGSPIQPAVVPSVSFTATAEDSVTSQAVAFLGKSKNLLLGIMNRGDEEYSSSTMARQQQVSRRLIRQASYFQTALGKPDQQQLKQLIHDLEIILMQLANIEVKPGVPAVELVKRGVNQKSILFKINVEEIRSATRETMTEKTENNKL